MFHQSIKEILHSGQDGQSVRICGWVRTCRVSKKFAFVVVNDGSCHNDLQLVVDAGTPAFEAVKKCTTGCSIDARGQLKQSQGREQKWEALVDQLDILGEASAEAYPLQKKGHTLEFLRSIPHLRPRSRTFGAVFRVRNVLSMGIHEYLQDLGFMWTHTPIITASDCEGAGEMFRVSSLDLNNLPKTDKGDVDGSQDFFGQPSFLTVSGQLDAEAFACSMGRVYTFGPTFRAENSNTTRHLSEFWMVEPEVAFCDLKGVLLLAEGFLKHLFQKVCAECPDELAFFHEHYDGPTADELLKQVESPFERISYTDAVSELKKSNESFTYPAEWGSDLQTEHERYLSEKVFGKPVFVTDYPKDIKAFYMRQNSDQKTVAAVDVLVPRVGELIGGSQREERLDLLEQRIHELKIPAHELESYLDLRRFGSVPHAGFGLGFERLVLYVTGMSNIRDVIPFPRAPGLLI